MPRVAGFLILALATILGAQTSLAGRLDECEEKLNQLLLENKYLRTRNLHTCEQLHSTSYNQTGIYALDPEGAGNDVNVTCDMDNGFTVVDHNKEGTHDVTWCQEADCYSLTLTYTIPMSQVEALIAKSSYCEQEIKFECKMAPLSNTAHGVKYGWWIGSNGAKKFYIDGYNAQGEIHKCDASMENVWNSDSGKITNRDDLPIKEFHYGGFFSNEQAARITIGKLKCSGSASVSRGRTAKKNEPKFFTITSYKLTTKRLGGRMMTNFEENSPTSTVVDIDLITGVFTIKLSAFYHINHNINKSILRVYKGEEDLKIDGTKLVRWLDAGDELWLQARRSLGGIGVKFMIKQISSVNFVIP